MDSVRSRIAFLYSALALHFARLRTAYLSILLAAAVIGFGTWMELARVPAGFPAGELIAVPEGASLTAVATALGERKIINSPLVFTMLVRLIAGNHGPKAGVYLFAEPHGLFYIAEALALGTSGVPPVRMTFAEGLTAREMGDLLVRTFPEFDRDTFLSLAKPLEGYLFPDTYLFSPLATPNEIVAQLYADFGARIVPLESSLKASGRSLRDVVIMASLVEREARTADEKQMIAGILWNRIKLGMPLQVDAVFGYIDGVTTYHPTLDDLASKSPYNTYTHVGLPPGAISNPGMDSLRAAIVPTETPYLYYLTGKDGKMHYAKTFAEHKRNRTNYLD